MEILDPNEQQYQLRKKVQMQATQREDPGNGGYFIKLIIQMSGGKIKNATQASYVLIVPVVIIAVLALLAYFHNEPHQVSPEAHWKSFERPIR